MSERDLEPWEQWVGSTAEPATQIKRGARVALRDEQHLPGHIIRRRWITYRDVDLRGRAVIVEMPENASTKSCHQDRHDACPHRLGGPQEGGVTLRLARPAFTWRCGCPCHNDPHRAGRLF